MQLIKKILLLSLFLQAPFTEIVGQQEVRVTKINYEEFIRFVRFDISVSQKPAITFTEALDQGTLTMNLDAHVPKSLALPQADPGSIAILQSGQKSVLQIKYPRKFRYESFYYAPKNKVIIDIHLGEKFVAKNNPAPIVPVQTTSSYMTALTALQNGDTTRAIQHFQKTIQSNPNHARAHLQLGILQALREEKDQAFVSLKKAQENVEFSFISNLYLQKLENTQQISTRVSDAQLPAPISQDENQNTTVVKTKPGASSQANTGKSGLFKSFLDLVQNRWLTLLAIIIMAASLYYAWRYMTKPKSSLKTGKDDQIRRIVNLMEKNNLYRSSKSPGQVRNPENRGRSTISPPDKKEIIDLNDSAEPATPPPRETVEKIQLAEGYPPAEQRIESSRLRQLQRTMNENNVVPESRNRLTPSALKVKSEVLDYALDGYSVREIAEKLQVGVGEVELVLGLKKTSPGHKAADDPSLRIDFSY
ncbi:MAG: hypothetical protein DWQ05_14130 [Calditrichaeota bacterium]|nr:MAG: hypothetical protein DWQ05_14130 [Calditrichota bacterium]